MFTYFIHCPATNRVKIGRAKNPATRLRDLQCASSSKLLLLGSIEGDHEYGLHLKFARSRVCGEWFELTPTLRSLIRQHTGHELPYLASECVTPTPADAALAAVHSLFGRSGYWVAEPDCPDSSDVDVTAYLTGWQEHLDGAFGYGGFFEHLNLNDPDVEVPDLTPEQEEIRESHDDITCALWDLIDSKVASIMWDGTSLTAAYIGTRRLVDMIGPAEVGRNLFGVFDEAGIPLNVFVIDRETGVVMNAAVSRYAFAEDVDVRQFYELDLNEVAAELAPTPTPPPPPPPRDADRDVPGR